jgi:urease accessory protein UreF
MGINQAPSVTPQYTSQNKNNKNSKPHSNLHTPTPQTLTHYNQQQTNNTTHQRFLQKIHHNNLTYPTVYNTNTKAQPISKRTIINEHLYFPTRNTVEIAQYYTKLNSTQLQPIAHPHQHHKRENYLHTIHTTHNSTEYYSHSHNQNCHSPPAL